MKTYKKKYKTGITFGAYEIFHKGHYNLLMNAKKQCERLIVCVSDDEYIRVVKKHEPALPCHLRKEIVRAIKFVDIVDCQSLDYGKKELVNLFRPDVIFVGSDHINNFTGEGLGVPVVYLPRTKGISSTKLKK